MRCAFAAITNTKPVGCIVCYERSNCLIYMKVSYLEKIEEMYASLIASKECNK